MGRKTPKGSIGKSPKPFTRLFAGRAETVADEELDLHGLAIDEAMVQAELALARWRNRPGACIRIIHGKSSGARDSIKGALRHNLETRWKNRVASFRQEPANPGATLVFLP
jgi:DNA-nicking Smr family endonuclease